MNQLQTEQTATETNLAWEGMQSSKESLAVIADAAEEKLINEAIEITNAEKTARSQKQKATQSKKPADVSPLLEKYSKQPTKSPAKQVPALLIPKNRSAVGYLTSAFSNKATDATSGDDGVDHINISAMGKTKLGKFLDINAKAPFNHPELSHFQSVGGLWFYVKSEDHLEDFRYIWGDRCRKLGKTVKTIDVVGFKTIIADATWIKIISNAEMVEELILSELPFKNYFYFGALQIKKITPEAAWYTKVIEEIRKILKLRVELNDESIQPDFSFLEVNR